MFNKRNKSLRVSEILWMSLKKRHASFNHLRRLWSIDILNLCHYLILIDISVFIWLSFIPRAARRSMTINSRFFYLGSSCLEDILKEARKA